MSRRSIWKGPFFDNGLLQTFIQKPKQKIKTTCRSSVILPFLIGSTLLVHNGKFYISLTINEEMIGHKLGEFVPTRLRHIYRTRKKKTK